MLTKKFHRVLLLKSLYLMLKWLYMVNPYQRKVKKWLGGSRKRRTYAARQRKMKILSVLAFLGLVGVVSGFTLFFGLVAYFSKDLPSPGRLSTREIPLSTKIYSDDGVLLYEIFGDQRRTLVVLEDIPEVLKQATIAVEDQDFYSHRGFDIQGILRAAFVTLRGGGLQGGSTITQQVVKNTLLSPERTIPRKIKEFILSIQLERKYTKDQILQMYFNESPYGGQAWGAGAAAEMYFGKHVRDLTLSEASLIAGLPQAPSLYSPCGVYPENAKDRQKVVLLLMEKNGFITKEQKEEEINSDVNVVCQGYSRDDIKAPHFVMYVKSVLTEMFGEKMVEQGGLRVMTTLDWKTQQIAQEEAEKQIASLAKLNVNATNAGVIVVDPNTGKILAMVGSVDYFDAEHDGNVNVVLAERQPGSSIKPITYLTAFKMGYTPATYLSDIRTCFPGGAGQPDYCPINWDDKYWGPMSVRTALANSRNIPAVKILQVVGVQNMIDMAHQLGITTLNEPERYGLSLTLGGGEVKLIDMAQSFSVFATLGEKNDLTPILRVEDSTGKVMHELKNSPREVVQPEDVYLLNHILSDSNARKSTFGNSLEIGRPIAVKTGTTNDNRDAWTVGFTPQVLTAVWVGNFNNESMRGIYGSTGATPIMKGVISRILAGQEVQNWQQPNKVIRQGVDKLSGLIPQEGKDFPKVSEIFVKGTQPTQVDDFHLSVQVCKDQTDKLATDYHKDNDLAEERTFVYLKELSKAWQPFTDQWMSAKRDEGYGHPPEEKCEIKIEDEVVEGPIIQIKTPSNNEVIEQMQFEVEAKIYTAERVTKVEFYWDDEIMTTINSEPYQVEYDLNQLDKDKVEPGSHNIRVKSTDSDGEEAETSIEVNLIKSSFLSPTPTI